MFRLVLSMQKERKYIITFFIYLAVFSFIYFLLDYLSGGYKQMIEDYGTYLVVINIALNILMSAISSFMFNLSTAQMKLTRRGEAAGYMSFLSVIFGIFTYGCTSCVVTFLSVLGISFTVAALPLLNLPYKLIGLGVLIIALIIQAIAIDKAKCKI